MSTSSSATMKALSTEVKTKTSATDSDPAFTIGASVLVGGVKPGRLRYIGGVHFVAGQWCGIELEDADGLHDGVVDGVRYFTCRDGHGIFAPRHRVTLRTHSRSSALPGSPDLRMRGLRKSTTNELSSSAEDGDMDRLLRVSSPRHRHQASLDSRDLDFSSTLKSGAERPQSAVLTDDELGAATDLSRKRSSLVTGRVVSSNTPKSSPKRVTFFDEIINSKERGVPSMRTDVQGTDSRQRGDENVNNDSQIINPDARKLAYDFDEGSPSRKTSHTDRPPNAQRAYVDSDLNNCNLDVGTTNLMTSNPEMSLSSDSIERQEIDDDFAAFGLTSVARTRLADAQNRSSENCTKSPKTRVEEALSDLEFMAGFSSKPSTSVSSAHSTTSSATRASFELARTALTQYADLIRAAQESTAVRQSWTPPAVRRVLPTPVATSSSAANCREFGYEPAPVKDLDVDGRRGRSPESATLDGSSGSGSGSADEVDFETFDGEELDSIGDAMIDSIDGSSVQSEDSIAMLPHLSDVEDDMVESGRCVDNKAVSEDSMTASDELVSTTRDQYNGNAVDYECIERTVTGSDNSNNVVDVHLLNEFNNAVTCRQLAFNDAQTYADISNVGKNDESLVISTVDSHAATITMGIANVDYFLRRSTPIRHERPMSLISSSSSTDTGCVFDIESDAMLSSGSMLTSSAGFSDGVMDESWLQRQRDVDETGASPDTLPVLNHCPLDDGRSSNTAVGNGSCHSDDRSAAGGNTVIVAAYDPATESTINDVGISSTDKSNSDLLLQAMSVNYEPSQPTAKESVRIMNESNEQMQALATTENGSVQKSQELDNDENDQSAVDVPVSTSESTTETHLPTTDATVPYSGPVDFGQFSNEIRDSSNLGVGEARSQLQSVESAPQTATESNAIKSEIYLTDTDDVKQTASSRMSAGEIVAKSSVSMRTQTKDSKKREDQTPDSEPSNSDQISSKKETDLSSSKPTVQVGTTDKSDTITRRSTTNPRSVKSSTSTERRSRGDTQQTGDKNTLGKSKLKRENDKAQSDADVKPSKSSSAPKLSTRTSPATAGRRDVAERLSNVTKNSKKGAVANATAKEAEKTPKDMENKTASSTAASDKRNERQNVEVQEKKAIDKVRETKSKLVNKNNAESTVQTKLSADVHNAGKETSSSTRKPSVVKSNPGPKDNHKDPETKTTTGKQQPKTTGLNPSVSNPATGATAAADKPADKSSKNPSTTGNPGNPKSVGDSASTSSELKEPSVPTKKPQQQRSTSSRTTAADKPTTAVPLKGASQTAKSTQRADKASGTPAGDSKAPKLSVRDRSTTQVDGGSTVAGQARRPTVESSKAKPTTSTAGSDRQRSSTATKPVSTTSAATKRTTRKPASLADQLAEAKEQLSSTLQQLEQSNKEKDTLQKSVESLREEHSTEGEKLHEELKQKLQTAAEQHEMKLQAEINRVIDQHSHEVNTLRLYHERQLSDMRREYENAAKLSQEEHSAAVARLEADHAATVTALKTEHEWQLNEITERFEGIKHCLSDTVEQLRARCDELSAREQMYAASWKQDSDIRKQAALEVNSLQVVLDQRNDEIRRLRQRQSDLETKLEEIPALKATISKHQQQTENLEAIVSIKTDHERQLAEMHQNLLKKFERESKAMKRLSMNNEELMWKLSQSDVGPLDDGDESGSRATTAREAAGGMFMSATLPSRGGRGSSGYGAMSRSYDSPRAMFGPSASGARQRDAKSTLSKQREQLIKDSKKTSSSPVSTSTSDSANSRLRRSGTYDVVDQ